MSKNDYNYQKHLLDANISINDLSLNHQLIIKQIDFFLQNKSIHQTDELDKLYNQLITELKWYKPVGNKNKFKQFQFLS